MNRRQPDRGPDMTRAQINRRQTMFFGLASAGLTLTGAQATTPAKGDAMPAGLAGPAGTLQHSMAPCRFGSIHYRYVKPGKDSGKTPLLCLHASPGSSTNYAKLLPLMGADRLSIAADNPGFGLSDRPPTPSTIADFAGAVGDLLDALGLEQVDLIGSHTGSATAVELARQRPNSVRRIVLHSALMFTPQEIADYEAKLVGSVASSLDDAANRMPDLWKRFAKFRTDLGDDLAWQLFWEMNRDPLHMGWGHDAAFAYDFAGNFRQLHQPILVLNPQEGLSPITARARGIAPNIAVMDLPWTGGVFSAHAAEVAPIIQKHLG